MSNYLRNLAARSLGQLDVVHPRRPSRYEPVHGIEDQPTDVTVEYEEPAGSPDGHMAGFERNTAARAPDHQPEYQPPDQPADQIEYREVTLQRQDPRLSELSPISVPDDLVLSPSVVDDRHEPVTEARQPIPSDPVRQFGAGIEENLILPDDPAGDRVARREKGSQSPPESRAAQQRSGEWGESHSRNREPRSGSLGESTFQLPRNAGMVDDELQHDVLHDLATILDDDSHAAGAEAVRRSRGGQLPPPPPAGHSPEFEQEPWPDVELPSFRQDEPPPIRVTIGRIDVRAVPPPAEPKRARPERPRPQLSLSDYLKQRSGGR